jgi:subfamily B ATP-binding cassette protein MsbA
MTDTEPTKREKLAAVVDAARFRPTLGVAIVLLSFGQALLEGVGVGFLLPIVELAQSSTPPNEADGILAVFVSLYAAAGIAFTLENLILGIAGVMAVRFGMGFVTAWLRAILGKSYQRDLRERLFRSILYGHIDYIDQSGSDDLLNSFITETNRAGGIAMAAFSIAEVALRGIAYFILAVLLAPMLTAIAVISLAGSTLFVRYILEPAYTVGDEVADTNNRIQSIAQTGFQGMRDVRLFTMRDELFNRMQRALEQFVSVNVRYRRNQAGLNNLNQFANAAVVFGLVYIGVTFTGFSLARLGVFLFAIFRLSPVINQINNKVYRLDGQLPHLIRVHKRLQRLSEIDVINSGNKTIETVSQISFDDVSFSYDTDETVLTDISFSVDRGEKIAFVGPSGAGKSTIVALLARLRKPDSGQIFADGTPVDEFNIEDWRNQLAIVRQNPFLFNGTLRENVTVGNRNASQHAVEQACEIARVTEFLPELPAGYDTELGEDGVRLSGGQKQRVAIARALLKDADVLVLDEATSELDSNIEQEVYDGIRGLEGQYITISIAHRLSTVRDADCIYTLVNGSVTETGTHEQLLKNKGTYADLYATQK